MQLLGGCGLCEKCVILASMAGVVQNAVVQNIVQYEPDFAIQSVQETGGSLANEESRILGEAGILKEDYENDYNFEPKKHSMEKKRDYDDKGNEPTSVESWCVIWYLGAFGCLVCFFLVITCTELFFGNPLYRTDNLNTFVQNIINNEHKSYIPETPPPPYHLFAPPDYNETIQKIVNEKRRSIDIFVVPVHGQPSSKVPAPPAYENVAAIMVNDKFTVMAVPECSSAVA